jgi:hypothetical protein
MDVVPIQGSEPGNNLEIRNIYASGGGNAPACLIIHRDRSECVKCVFSSFNESSTVLLGMSCMHCGVWRAKHRSVSWLHMRQATAAHDFVREREREREFNH